MEVGIPQDPQPWLPQRIVSLACDPLRTLRQQRAILQLSRMDQIEGVQRLTALAAPLHDSYQKTFTDQFVTTITRSLYVTSCPAIVRGLFCPNFGASPLALQLFAGAEIRPRHIARGPAYPPPAIASPAGDFPCSRSTAAPSSWCSAWLPSLPSRSPERDLAFPESRYAFPPAKIAELITQSSTTDRYFKQALAKLGIRDRPQYNARHTYATMCLMSGMSPAFIVFQLGHSVQMLLSTYARWIDSTTDWHELDKLDTEPAKPTDKTPDGTKVVQLTTTPSYNPRDRAS